MRPLLVNTFDVQGGAAIATYRLHVALRNSGIDSTLLVQKKSVDDRTIVTPSTAFARLQPWLRPRLEQLPVRAYGARAPQLFSPAVLRDSLAATVQKLNPDIVHLFWIARGFIRPESLATLKRPVVWTLHDMWPFTGGCHYDSECGRYTASCGACPALGSAREHDLSRRVWERKSKAWRKLDITVVATSRWLADCARASSLFVNARIETLPNCLDTTRYKPLDKLESRRAFNLPQHKRLILISADNATSDRRKGYHHLVDALRKLASESFGENAELIVVGASKPEADPGLGMKVNYLGRLHDDISQAILYSAADLLVAPSEQENLSNTVLESLACGTPVVAFNIGGMPDLVSHQQSGYLAAPFDTDCLARGITWTLGDPERHEQLSRNARSQAESRHNPASVAGHYARLYEQLLP